MTIGRTCLTSSISRDELLYYARDENQFLRRRRTFVFALQPDLVQARFKDAELPWQRIVLLLGLILAAISRLIDWLSEDSLVFEVVFLGADNYLAAERALLDMILRDQIANGTVVLANLAAGQLAGHCESRARRACATCSLPVLAVNRCKLRASTRRR